MKTFEAMLVDKERPFTQDMRDAVEAFSNAAYLPSTGTWYNAPPLRLMRTTPPAKEPARTDVEIRKGPRILGSCNIIVMPFEGWAPGDRARVTKREGGR